jgi:hypothetical protein
MGNRYTIDEWQRVMSVSNEISESVDFESSESAVPDGCEPTTSVEPSESVAGGEPTTSVEPSESVECREPTTSVEPSESVAGEPTTSVEPSESVAGERKVKRRTFRVDARVIS